VTSLTIVRRIAARPETVFDLVTTPEGMRGWWGPDDGPVLAAESDRRIGGSYRVRFRMLDGTEHEGTGEYLAFDPPREVAMTWRWAVGGVAEEGESQVAFVLRPIAEGTELTLTHSMLVSDQSAEEHGWGWNGALDKLEALVAAV
jgi:uncharacterized protein YndB with AHSA1/START domain